MVRLVRLNSLTDGEPTHGRGTGPLPAASVGRLRGRHVILASLAGRGLVGLRSALAGAGARPVDASDLSGAIRHAAVLGPRAALVIDLAGDIKPVRPAISALSGQDAVLLLTATATRAERVGLLGVGADHVLNTGAPGEVIACLSAVLRRSRPQQTVNNADVLRVGDLCLDPGTRTATSAGRCLTLTVLEFDLLAYFMAEAGRALTRQRLLADVWGYDTGGLDTVTVHVRRLRTKIEVDPSHPVLLRTVWGIGYRLETDGAQRFGLVEAWSTEMPHLAGSVDRVLLWAPCNGSRQTSSDRSPVVARRARDYTPETPADQTPDRDERRGGEDR